MRKRSRRAAFFEELKAALKGLKRMRPEDVYVVSVEGDYGRYNIMIGPERRGKGGAGFRPIEISGQIHHIFATDRGISVYPSKRQVIANMKGTVIMRDLSIRVFDPMGNGGRLTKGSDIRVHPRECINLAGEEGDALVMRAENDRRYAMSAYRIAQGDILKSLERRRSAAH